MVRTLIAAAARGPSSRLLTELLISVAVEAVFLALLGAARQTRLILGIPGSLMALTAVVADAMGGPIIGSVVVLVGAVIYYATVASFVRGALLPALVATVIWVSTALISAFLSGALRQQATKSSPPRHIVRPDLEVITRYLSSEGRLRLGGDFIDVMSLPREGLALIIGDVSDHGPAAAALGATLRATWQSSL